MNVLIQLFLFSTCFEHLMFIMYNIVFLMMNIECSKHVEDKKNRIKTLI
jgi:hypothetical protein